MNDQAEELRKKMAHIRAKVTPSHESSCKILAITSGKGGVGKSNLTLNLGIALAREGARVLLFDADIGTANLDILLGIHNQKNLGHVFEGEFRLPGVLYPVSEVPGLTLVPGASGISELKTLPFLPREHFRIDLEELASNQDLILIDTGAGVHPALIRMLMGSDGILLVCTPEPTSLVDAYSLCKVLFQFDPEAHVKIVANLVADQEEAHEVCDKLRNAVRYFLYHELELLGYVPRDPAVAEAVSNQRPFLLGADDSPASAQVIQIAKSLLRPGEVLNPEKGKGVRYLIDSLIH